MKKPLLRFARLVAVWMLSFGYSFAQDEAVFDRPIDASQYLIRPGDSIFVTFIKSKLPSLGLVVDAEARIVDERTGQFDLRHKTLQQARQELLPELRKLYNIEDIVISVNKPRPVTISVIGAVRNVGMHKGMTSERVSDIILRAGGILPDGSRRRIVFSGGPNTLQVDLDRAAMAGEVAFDPCLYAGYTVYVPNRSEQVVEISGEVNSPRTVELLPNDDLKLLLTLAGGMRGEADSAAIKIISKDQLNKTDHPLGGDVVIVPPRTRSALENRIAVFGSVLSPGYYSLDAGFTLQALLDKVGGVTEDGNLELTTVFRRPLVDHTGRTTDLRFPISRLVRGAEQFWGLKLAPDDSVFVPSRVGYIRVRGEVFNPGYYPYLEGKDAFFYINSAGGFLPTANQDEISIFNPVSGITILSSSKVIVGDGSELVVNLKEELK